MLNLLFDIHSRSSVHNYSTFSAKNIGKRFQSIGIFTLASILSLHAFCVMARIPFPPNPAYEGFGHVFSVAVASGRENPVMSSELATRTFNETAFIESLPLTDKELRRMTNQKRAMHTMIMEGNENVTHIGGNATHPFLLQRYTLPFGSMIRNWCNMTAPNGTFSLLPSGFSLPSILRGMEIMMSVQLSFRLIVMLTISIRWVATMIGDYRVATRKGCPSFVHWTAALHTPTVVVQMLSISLLTTVHSDIDKSIRLLIPISLICFCVSSILDMGALIVIDRANGASPLRRSLRELLFLLSFVSFPVIYTAHMEFFDAKVCSIQVPWWVALAEYSFALAVSTTCLLQMLELSNIELAVHASEEEVQMRIHHSFVGQYEPCAAFEEDGLEIYSTSFTSHPKMNKHSLNFPRSLVTSDLREIVEYGEAASFQFYNCKEVDHSTAFSPERQTREHPKRGVNADWASRVEVIRGVTMDEANSNSYPSTIGAVLVASGQAVFSISYFPEMSMSRASLFVRALTTSTGIKLNKYIRNALPLYYDPDLVEQSRMSNLSILSSTSVYSARNATLIHIDDIDKLHNEMVHDENYQLIRAFDSPTDSMIRIPVKGRDFAFSLNLRPISSNGLPFTSDFSIVEDGIRHYVKPRQFLFEGHVEGDPDSRVYGSVFGGIFEGRVHSSDGSSHMIERITKFYDMNKGYLPYHSGLIHDKQHQPNMKHSLHIGLYDSVYAYFKKRSDNITKTDESIVKTCTLHLKADHRLYQEILKKEGRNDPQRTREEIASMMFMHVKAVNDVFEKTSFNGNRTVRFAVKQISIETQDNTNQKTSIKATNEDDAQEYITKLSLTDHSDSCLSFAFTYSNFNKGVLGIAAMAGVGRQGGLCSAYVPLENEKLFTSLSKHQPVRVTFNTGVITLCSEGKVYNC